MQEHTGYTPTTFVYPFGVISDAAVPIIRSLGFSATLGCANQKNTITRDPECLYGLGRFLRPPGQKMCIRDRHKGAPGCKIMVGGAVLTQEYADMIHADHYAKDAMDSVRYAHAIFGR